MRRSNQLSYEASPVFRLPSLAPIFSICLSSFLETKIFWSNETSLCDVLDVFLFSGCHTNTSGQQPTDTNLELSSAFGGKVEGGADEKAGKFENLNVNDARF